MVPHSCILKTLELVGTARNIIELLKRSMQSWRTVLFSGKIKLGKVNARRGIFQGDSLSPLLFVVALIPVTIILRTLKQGYSFGKRKERLNHLLFMDNLNLYGSNDNEIDSLVKVVKILSGGIGMQFEFDKCAVLKMKRGKQAHCEGIDLGDGAVIEEADEERYKYRICRSNKHNNYVNDLFAIAEYSCLNCRCSTIGVVILSILLFCDFADRVY